MKVSALKDLSSRELEVLRLIAKGRSNKQIAASLKITVGTVEVHVHHILKKLRARNRTEAACWLVRKRVPASKKGSSPFSGSIPPARGQP